VRVCVILCFLCIVVPLPPGTYPLAVNNNNNNNNNFESKKHVTKEAALWRAMSAAQDF
jgi:hypothetical protein